jgi:hypothetical protein
LLFETEFHYVDHVGIELIILLTQHPQAEMTVCHAMLKVIISNDKGIKEINRIILVLVILDIKHTVKRVKRNWCGNTH